MFTLKIVTGSHVALTMVFYAFTAISYVLLQLWRVLKTNLELEQMRKIAYIDTLTQLENRRAYAEYMEALKEQFRQGKTSNDLSVVMLDVNGLKTVNDTLGHKAGDELIMGSAQCIRQCFGSIGRCFHTGGDEFVVIAAIDHQFPREKARFGCRFCSLAHIAASNKIWLLL